MEAARKRGVRVNQNSIPGDDNLGAVWGLKAYPNFQMVHVPAGEHTLTFEFHSIYYSLVILNIVTGFLGGAAFLFWLANLNFAVIRKWFPIKKLFTGNRSSE